jgi:hypothetical protein
VKVSFRMKLMTWILRIMVEWRHHTMAGRSVIRGRRIKKRGGPPAAPRIRPWDTMLCS